MIWSIYKSWDIKQNILKLVILGHFLPFYPPKKWKFWKMSSFYTCVPKITITWCMVPDLGKFLIKNEKNTWGYYSFIHTCVPKWRSNDIWFLKYKVQQTDIFAILGHFFFALSAPWHPEKSKFYHWEKTPGDNIILVMCSKNDNHMMYSFWDIEHNRQNFLSFWTILCPFTQNQNFEKKKKKNASRYYYFTQVWHKWQSYDQGIIQTKMAVGIWFWVPNLDSSPKYYWLFRNGELPS